MPIGFHGSTTPRLISQWNKAAALWCHICRQSYFATESKQYSSTLPWQPLIPYVVTIMLVNYRCVGIQDHKMNPHGRRKFTPVGECGSGRLTSATEETYDFVGLTLKLLFFHCTMICVVETIWTL